MESEDAVIIEWKRDEVIALALSANTQEQCKDAEKMILAWMKNHPRDFGMLDAGEQLAMMSERYDRGSEEGINFVEVLL